MTIINDLNDASNKLKQAIEENFNLMISDLYLESMDFESIYPILDNLLNNIKVSNNSNYKEKKRFNKFINYDCNIIRNYLKINDDIDKKLAKIFEDEDEDEDEQKIWYYLHITMVSYLSYLKMQNEKKDLNYNGMITKLINKIEEFNKKENEESSDDSESSESEYSDTKEFNLNDPQKILDQLNNMIPKTEKSTNVMNDLLGDIKGLLNKPDNISSKSIVDISKDLSSKYQTMIEKGDVNIGDLLSGVMNLLNDPESLEGHFDDINTENLPDPSKLLSEMTSDPNIKKAMDMIGSNSDNTNSLDLNNMMASMMGGNDTGGLNLNNMMASMMGGGLANMIGSSKNSDDIPKTTEELEKEIERLITEINSANQENQETI